MIDRRERWAGCCSTVSSRTVRLVSSRQRSSDDESRYNYATWAGDEETIHEREHNWGLRQQKWAHTHTRKQAASPNPTTSHSRLQTNSEPDPSAPAGSAKWFVTVKGRPAEQHLSSRHSASSPEAPEQAELDISTTKPTNGYPHDRPLRMPSRHPRPHSPLPPLL
jgi:hypothetical protein